MEQALVMASFLSLRGISGGFNPLLFVIIVIKTSWY